MYGILISTGILIAALLSERRAKKLGLDTNILWDGLFFTIVSGVIGARVYFVVENWWYFAQNPLQILYIHNGGMRIVGGLVFGGAALALFLYSKKQPILKWLDIAALYMPLAQFVGRWGNIANNELVMFAIYEIVLNLGLFAVLWLLRDAFKKDGAIFSLYVIGYAAIRFLLEDFQPYSPIVGGLSVVKSVSLAVIVVILVVHALHYIRSRRI